MADALKPPDPNGAPASIAGAVVAWMKLHPAPAYRCWLKFLVSFAGDEHLGNVGRDLLVRFHLWLRDYRYRRLGKIINRQTGERAKHEPRPLTAETVRHAIRSATAVLRWAHGAGWLRVLPDVPKTAKPLRQDRDVDPAKLWEIIDALPDRAGRILRFIAGTGCRPSEACGLEWAHVHLDAGVCILPMHKTAAKTGAPRTICLTDEARAALKGLKPGPGPVFQNRHGGRYTPMGLCSILRRHGGITPYQLRHTFCQTAAEAEVPVDVLAKLLGHQTTEMTAHYYSVRDRRAIGAAATLRLRPGKGAKAG
jgi:integrase/recombinase XerC